MFKTEAQARSNDGLIYKNSLSETGSDLMQEDFEDMVDQEERVVYEEMGHPEDEKEGKPVVVGDSGFVVTGEELLNMNLEEMPWLIEGLLPKTGVAALAGSSDTGKSSFLRQLAGDIVCGEQEFLGFKVNSEHHNVIMVSTEDDFQATSVLLRKQNSLQRQADCYKNLRYIFETDDLISKLDIALQQQAADCVVIDTFTDLYGGEMNQSNKVRNFLNGYGNLAKKHNCLFIFLHHMGKRTDLQPPSKDNLLGSQGFEAKMRLVLELRKDCNNSAIRHLCIVKGNYIREDDKKKSYVLTFDEQMRYSNTGERVSFEKLVKPDPAKAAQTEARARVMELQGEGLSITRIKQSMDKEGFQVGRSTIGTWVKERPVIQQAIVSEDGWTEE